MDVSGGANRIIPSYCLHMWMATQDNGLAATLYGPCEVSALAGPRVPVKVTTMTDYPFGEVIRIKMELEKPVEFPLYLRVPKWCKNAQITVNGDRFSGPPAEKGFVRITRTWSNGDVVELTLPMEPRVIRGFETEFPATNRSYFDFVPEPLFQPRRLPYASVLYGPLLFALPIPDIDPNTPVANAQWQYALDTDPAHPEASIKVERKPMPEQWDWPLDAPVALDVPAQYIDWHPTDAQALPDKPVSGTQAGAVRLVPYGCTKFRIAMFPVTPKTMGDSTRSE